MTKGGPAGPPCHGSYPFTSCGEAVLDRCDIRSRGGRNPHESALVQNLGNLHRIGGGALEQVVADDPHLQAAVVGGIAPQAADEDLVATGGGERGRVAV